MFTRVLLALSGWVALAVRTLRRRPRPISPDLVPNQNPYGLTPPQLQAKAEIDKALDAGGVADIRLPRRGGSTYLAHIIHKERGGVVAVHDTMTARRFTDEHYRMFGERPDVIATTATHRLHGRPGPVIADTCGIRPDHPPDDVILASRDGGVRFWNEDTMPRREFLASLIPPYGLTPYGLTPYGLTRTLPTKTCDQCSSPYCECDGTCDEDYATSCHRCDTWVCGYCVVEGACHDCFSKMQGGVN